jgi:hypothetical protein
MISYIGKKRRVMLSCRTKVGKRAGMGLSCIDLVELGAPDATECKDSRGAEIGRCHWLRCHCAAGDGCDEGAGTRLRLGNECVVGGRGELGVAACIVHLSGGSNDTLGLLALFLNLDLLGSAGVTSSVNTPTITTKPVKKDINITNIRRPPADSEAEVVVVVASPIRCFAFKEIPICLD